MAFELMPLPFPKDSLGPTISARTLDHHHGKHHATYVTKLNEFIAGTPLEKQDLESIIKATANKTGTERKIFNNAAQVWNHDFFWNSLAPERRRRAAGADQEAPGSLVRLVREFPRQVRRSGRRPVRQRLGLAGREGRQARDHHDARRRQSADHQRLRAVDRATFGSTPTTWTTSRTAPAS